MILYIPYQALIKSDGVPFLTSFVICTNWIENTMPRTRRETSSVTSSNLREFIGEPANFTGTQLPTYRDAIKQAMMLQREDTRSKYKCYSLKEIMTDVYSLLLPIWEKANSDLFKLKHWLEKII